MPRDSEEAAAGLEMADPKVGWVYKLNKEGLSLELRQLNLETGGTVDEMRRRLITYLRAEPTKRQEQPPVRPEMPPERPRTSVSFELLNQIRKLNIVFDGKSDPVSFLERLEQVQEEYEITGDQLLKTLPGLMQGKANQWYMNYKSQWQTYYDFIEDFKTFFYPPDYRENLEEAISKKYQNKQDTARDFILDMQTMMRRHGGYSREREVTCIYQRLKPAYRQYIRRRDVNTISDLLQLTYEFDQLQLDLEREAKAQSRKEHASTFSFAANRGSIQSNYEIKHRNNEQHRRPLPKSNNPGQERSRNILCWRCGSTGHTRFDCRGTPKIFCSRCGQEGRLTKDCGCTRTQENMSGPGSQRGRASPTS